MAGGGQASARLGTGERKTVLVADNSRINRMFLAGILSDKYNVLEAEDGTQCLELMSQNPDSISVVLLDLMMPGMTGYEVLAAKSQDSAMAGIPVIVVTAGAETATELEALNAGAIDFLSKPIEPELAKRRIRLAIDQRELEALHIKTRIYEERQYAVDHDELTGLYSKDAFCRETQQLLAGQQPGRWCIVRWNIEKFKLVNSLFGMKAGDAMLCALADSIRSHEAELGTYGRYVSDNFVACMDNSPEKVQSLVAQVESDLQKAAASIGLTQSIVLAVGVFEVGDCAMQVEEMCDYAGMALSTIKGDYSSHLAYYDNELSQRMLEEQEILDNMEAALDKGEFEVYLQPVYDMATGLPASAEALVRWNRPGMGIVAPGVFIPLFERNGFISRLDYQILQQVCLILKERASKGLPELPISVNLSRKSLYDPGLYDKIVSLTDRHDINPALFRLEITESAYMDNAEQLIETVLKLQEHGYPVLMDDFGSGYSSLNTLREIPVDILKLDMKFMEGFEQGGRVGTIVASMLRMAKWLGVPVVAEGVETVEQYEFLRSVGCEYTQGFYFARPMPREDFEVFIANPHVPTPHEASTLPVGDINTIMGGSPLFDRIAHNIFDAVAVYEYAEGDILELVRANDDYFALFGLDSFTFKRNVLSEVLGASEEGYGRFLDVCRRAYETGEVGSVLLQCSCPRGDSMSLNAICCYSMPTSNSTALQVFAFKRVDSEGRAVGKSQLLDADIGAGKACCINPAPAEAPGAGIPVLEAAKARTATKAKRVVIATNNAHKAAEIETALDFEGWAFETLAQARIVSEPVEDADTFEGNARIKAQAAQAKCGCAVLADDSGLEVDALGGAPGVHSSRFAGQDGDNEANNALLLAKLEGVPDAQRTARFVCTLVFIDENGDETVARGTIEGKIAHSLSGEGGFGYDPLFLPDCFGGSITLAQVSQAQKNLVSHRGNALRNLRMQLASKQD